MYTYVVLYVCIDMLEICVCIYTNTVSTNTPSGATPTVQDVIASHAERNEQGMSVHNCCMLCNNVYSSRGHQNISTDIRKATKLVG